MGADRPCPSYAGGRERNSRSCYSIGDFGAALELVEVPVIRLSAPSGPRPVRAMNSGLVTTPLLAWTKATNAFFSTESQPECG